MTRKRFMTVLSLMAALAVILSVITMPAAPASASNGDEVEASEQSEDNPGQTDDEAAPEEGAEESADPEQSDSEETSSDDGHNNVRDDQASRNDADGSHDTDDEQEGSHDGEDGSDGSDEEPGSAPPAEENTEQNDGSQGDKPNDPPDSSVNPPKDGPQEGRQRVTYCHAKPADTAKNGWNELTTSVAVFFQSGHDQHAADIVKPFTYVKNGETIEFPGMNWPEGKEILENGCNKPVDPDPDPDFGELTASITYECGNTFTINLDRVGGNIDATALVIIDGEERYFTVSDPGSMGFPITSDTTVVVKQIGLKGEVLRTVLDTTIVFEECDVESIEVCVLESGEVTSIPVDEFDEALHGDVDHPACQPVVPPAPVVCPSGYQRWVNPNLGNRAAARIVNGGFIATGLEVPAGPLSVTNAVSWDGYPGRWLTNQTSEVWGVSVGGTTFGPTIDIADGVNWDQTVTDDMGTRDTAGGQLVVIHMGTNTTTANSVVPVSFCYMPVPPEPEPEPKPTIVVEQVVCDDEFVTHQLGNLNGEEGSVAVFSMLVNGVETIYEVPAGEVLEVKTPLPLDGSLVDIYVSSGYKGSGATYSHEPCPVEYPDPEAEIGELPCIEHGASLENLAVSAQLGNDGGPEGREFIVTVGGVMTVETAPADTIADIMIPLGNVNFGDSVYITIQDAEGNLLAETTVSIEECDYSNPSARVEIQEECYADASVTPKATIVFDNSDANVGTLFTLEQGYNAPPIGTAIAPIWVPAGEVKTVEVELTFGEELPVVITAEGMEDVNEVLLAELCPPTEVAKPDASVKTDLPCDATEGYLYLSNGADASKDARFWYQFGEDGYLAPVLFVSPGQTVTLDYPVTPGKSVTVYVWDADGIVDQEFTTTVETCKTKPVCDATSPTWNAATGDCTLPKTGDDSTMFLVRLGLGLLALGLVLRHLGRRRQLAPLPVTGNPIGPRERF